MQQKSILWGVAENERPENDGQRKLRDWNLMDWKITNWKMTVLRTKE